VPALLMQAVQAGASRNVYIGGIQDFETFNMDKLKADFATFGGESEQTVLATVQ
jgi:hypothetical protein